jgi:hypothetical protein
MLTDSWGLGGGGKAVWLRNLISCFEGTTQQIAL